MSCIRLPASLADAVTIVEACGGPGWRALFVLGLAVAVGLGVLLALAVLTVRSR